MQKKLLKDSLASKALPSFLQSKKESEKAIMQGFLERIGIQQFTLTERERPDFEISIPLENDHVTIACELTDFATDKKSYGSGDRRFQKLWLSFAEALRRRLQNEGLSHYYGAIHFKTPDRTKLPAKNEVLIEEIVQAVKQCIPHNQNNGSFTIKPAGFPTLEQHIEHIYIKNTTPEHDILWWCAHLQTGEMSLVDTINGIQNSIVDKNNSANSYQWPDSKEKWLLVYAPSRGIHDTAFIESSVEEVEKIKFQSACFDRIFLWDKWGENVYQLYPSFHTILERARTLYVKHLPEYMK